MCIHAFKFDVLEGRENRIPHQFYSLLMSHVLLIRRTFQLSDQDKNVIFIHILYIRRFIHIYDTSRNLADILICKKKKKRTA